MNTGNSDDRRVPEEHHSDPAENVRLRAGDDLAPDAESRTHVLGPGIICDTEPRGHATPRGRSPLEIVVDASEGFIPLWAGGTTLRWRFREQSMDVFVNPGAAKLEIRNLLGEALLQWGTAAPIVFTEDVDVWDFEIVMRSADNCNISGCVLASAFFPDPGRHELALYPKMFTQSRKEQIDTFIHEIGHVFGLRHFFAKVSESAWPSEIFGKHAEFSIMNYGSLSELTDQDKEDLVRLYGSARNGTLTHINGTPIRLVKPYHTIAAQDSALAIAQAPAAIRSGPQVPYLGD